MDITKHTGIKLNKLGINTIILNKTDFTADKQTGQTLRYMT